MISHRQHQINPYDATIPTWSQLINGVSSIVRADVTTGKRMIVTDSVVTLKRFSIGLAVSVISAIVLGLLMGSYAAIESLFAAPLSILAKVPPTAVIALFFALAGIGDMLFILIIVFGILPSLALSVHLSIKQIPDELINKASTLGASQTEIIWNVIVRCILPDIIDAIRLQIGPAIVFLIAAELLLGGDCIGRRIFLTTKTLDMSVVYPYLGLLAGFGFSMDYLLRRLQRWLCPWRTKDEG
ncbi:MAG: ABC transporter permease subunit [Planctomycetota bacterium]